MSISDINLISVVVPFYNETKNVNILYGKLKESLERLNYDYELIFVNDGSKDNTWKRIVEINKKDDRVKGVDLAGNYGQTIALRSGFECCSGDVIFAMDGDLQHDPAYIPQMVGYFEQGYELVSTYKDQTPDGKIKAFLSRVAHNYIKKISGVSLKYFGATFKGYRRYLLEDINLLADSHRFLGSLVLRKGVKYIEFPIKIKDRQFGKSSYSISKLFTVLIDLIFLKFLVSYMTKPFRLFGLWGIICFGIGFFLMSLILGGWAFAGIHVAGDYLAEFVFSIFLILFGLFMLLLGFVAEIGVYNYYSTGQKSYRIRSKV